MARETLAMLAQIGDKAKRNHLALLCAEVRVAIDDARDGDPEAIEWIDSDAPRAILSHLVETDDELDVILVKLTEISDGEQDRTEAKSGPCAATTRATYC